MLDRLEKRLRRLAIPNLTVYLVAGQAFFFLVLLVRPALVEAMALVPNEVLAGEIWRLLTFLLVPPGRNALFVLLGLYLFWLFGNALEHEWGSFRYNLYLLVGALATIGAAWAAPDQPATNAFLGGSVFLAFAALYPDFELLVFFVVPVKVKWLALVAWLFYAVSFLGGDLATRLAVAASVSNTLLFFGPGLWRRARSHARRRTIEAASTADRRVAFHRCARCGATDVSHPRLEFRYCPQCTGSPGYCEEHIHDHEHV